MKYQIIEKSRELTRREEYKLCVDDQSTSVQEAEGYVFEIDAYVKYITQDSEGKDLEVLAILTKDGEVLSTVSETFKRHFFDIWEAFAGTDEPFEIVVTSGTSRSGRKFASCTLK